MERKMQAQDRQAAMQEESHKKGPQGKLKRRRPGKAPTKVDPVQTDGDLKVKPEL
jgi:hypothetical protein